MADEPSKTMLHMIPQTWWKGLLAAGLLVMAPSMASSAEVAPEKAKPMAPNDEIVDIQNSGLANIRDKDPKILAIRSFSVYKGGVVDEGLEREVISLTYARSRRQANAIVATYGLSDDSVNSIRYVAILVLDGEQWRLKQARKQWTCQPGRGHQEWSAQRCR
jgi:hypothetical protein